MIPGNYRHKKTWDLDECWDTCPLCAFNKGRASRDGLRKALDEILAISTIESMGQTEIAIKALEADEDSK